MGRTAVIALTLLALLAVPGAFGWSAFAPNGLRQTTFEPVRYPDEPRRVQTLAHTSFEAGGGTFALSVLARREIGDNSVITLRLQRVAGANASLALIADRIDGVPWGPDGPFDPQPSLDQLEIPKLVQLSPGEHALEAVAEFAVREPLLVGYVERAPIEVRVPFTIRASSR